MKDKIKLSYVCKSDGNDDSVTIHRYIRTWYVPLPFSPSTCEAS